MTSVIGGLAVGVDLGKTGCRVAVTDGEHRTDAEGQGAPGLSEPNGVADADAAIRAVLAETGRGGRVASMAVGAAGAAATAGVSAALAESLADAADSVAVASDAVTAHAGGLNGDPGTVLAIGTGSVAVGLSADGVLRLRGGWGPWLGDDGSGFWIGRMALRAVLAADEGWGPKTSLTTRALDRFGGPARSLANAIHADGGVARTVATFTPDVLAAADDGDEMALRVLDEAVSHWVAMVTSSAEAARESDVAVVGGLANARRLFDDFVARLPAGLTVRPAAGGPLDGALLLAQRRDLPHEELVARTT